MRSFYRKRKIIFILLIVVGILSLSSITYAIFTVTTSQSGTNEINTMKCLELTFSNQENNINLVNTYPMTDERGAKNTPYTFTITNNCGTYIEYSVGLIIDDANTLEDKYVKTMFSLKDDVGEAILLTDREEGKKYNDNKTYLFRRDGLQNSASKEYKLRLWVDGSGTYETVTNKSFNSKIIINAYPQSEESIITINADLNGGHLYQELNEVYRPGDKVKLPIPAKEGHSFKAWEVVSGDATIEGNTLTVGSEDITIKATYKVGITVTLDLDGGMINQSFDDYYYEEDKITLDVPTKDGYIFTGWEVTSGDGILNDNILTVGKESNVIKANWQKIIKLTINLNGGTSQQIFKENYLQNEIIELVTPQKNNSTFAGWSIVSGNAVILKNMILNGSFEDGLNNWKLNSTSAGTLSITQDKKTFGTNSLKGIKSSSAAHFYPLQCGKSLIQGHIYYAFENIYVLNKNTTDSSQFDMLPENNTGNAYPEFGDVDISASSNWQRLSFIFTSTLNHNNYCLRPFYLFEVIDCYVDGVVLIDLTESYGLGNEPSQTVLDRYISYFDDNLLILDNTDVTINAQWS